jgi:signal transduction histidine kinase/ligand-binding sensor domain-containing protein
MLWVGLILLLAGSSAPASTQTAWFTRVWNTDDGLLNDQVDAIVQGRDNYLWVVPPVGLMRFDGVRFSRFPIEDFTGPIDNHICTVLYERSGVLWLTTYGGRVLGLKPDFSLVAIPNASLPKGTPPLLAEDDTGALWLGYPSVICRVKDRHVTRFGPKEGMPPGKLHSLICDGAGNIWMAKGNQICVFRNGQFQRITAPGETRCLAATPTNAVWLVTGEHLWTCDTDGALWDAGAIPNLSRATGRALLEDRTGAVWIGTDGNGLIRYSKSGFDRVKTSYPSILGLAEDREGNIWVGTDGGGLDRVSLSAVRLEALENQPVLGQVQSICEATNGMLWGTAYNGWPYHGELVSRINGRWTPVFTNALFTRMVTCVAADCRGGIWVGTRDGKLLRLVNTNEPTLVQNTSHGTIYALLAASNGDLWIVDYRTLQCFHHGQLQEVKLPRKVERISAIAEDAAGNIWIGAKGVVMRFDGTRIVDETPGLPISGRWIHCLYGTPDGSLWIGGGGLGLLRFKDGHASQIRSDQGLLDDYISQMVTDGHGRLWFGSDHGIFKIRQRDLEQAMQDHNIHLRPVAYGRNEGLPNLAALVSLGSPFAFPRAIRTHDGRVWLLTHTGLVTADPQLLPENSVSPPVLLTRVAMDGQTIASYGGIAATEMDANLKTQGVPLRLPPGYRHLEFEFTAFHFTAPENLHFRYQLAGFDDGWIDADTERHADYSRLTAGNYQFRVEACVGDGPWSETPVALALTVMPFFWQTWWFRLGVLLLFTASVIAVVRYISFRRMRRKLRAAEQQAAIERERGRIARDIHDDLGNRLTEIQLLTGLAQSDRTLPDNSIAGEISSAARQATDALDEIVWAINPGNDTLPHLIDYLGQFAVEFLQTAGIRCRVDLPEQPPAKSVSAEVRHNLFLVIKESLNNIVRHAGATEVSLLILVTDETISVIIEDNGRGFNGEVKNNGADGLKNMRQRITEIGGQFQIKSKPGAGTWISFNGSWLAGK